MSVKDKKIKIENNKLKRMEKDTDKQIVTNNIIDFDSVIIDGDIGNSTKKYLSEEDFILLAEKKKLKILRKDIKILSDKYMKEIDAVINNSTPSDDKTDLYNGGVNYDVSSSITDVDGYYIKQSFNYYDSSDGGGDSGYEADSDTDSEPKSGFNFWGSVTPALLFNEYDYILKEKKRLLYNNLIATRVNYIMLNYVNYLFYRGGSLMLYPESIYFKLAARKYRFRLNKYRNRLYYSKKVNFEILGLRAILQLTSRYRNKFFTFLRKTLHFNLSVGRVFFWKLKKTVYGRVVNFYNVFFRCVLPFLSRRFTILLYKLFKDWSGDFQKFNGAVMRARRYRKIRRNYSIFKVIIFPKLIYGFMRLSKYPVRKRFLQRRSFIKYMCS